MAMLWSNNASTTIAGSITATDTSVALAAGTGVLFPQPAAPDYYVATFYDQATKTINEIVHVTHMAGDVATITRGQEGTTPQAWNAADIFANLVTAGTLRNFVQVGPGPADTSIVYVGIDVSTTPGLVIATTTPVPPQYDIGMLFNIKIKNTNPGPVQLQLNGLAAVAAVRTNGSAMVGGNLTANEEMIFIWNGTNFTSMVPPIPAVPPQLVFYVRTDGNDNNSGFANDAADAFRTISGAMYQIKQRYISQLGITIRVADGFYTDAIIESTNYIASWTIIGNTANPGNVVIVATATSAASYPPYAAANGVCVTTVQQGAITMEGFTFQSYYNNAVAGDNGVLNIQNCDFTAPTSGGGNPCSAGGGGVLGLVGNVQYTGSVSSNCIFHADSGGTLAMASGNVFGTNNLVVNISGTPVLTEGTVSAESGGKILIYNPGVAFTGSIPSNGSGGNCNQFTAMTAGGVLFSHGYSSSILPGTGFVVTPPGYYQ